MKLSEDKKNTFLLGQEIKLAKILAGNNKTLRERTLKRLKKFLEDRMKASHVDESAFMRIWKGLFYYMWMADKPLIQEECAEKISLLMHFEKTEDSLQFFKCFLKTMTQEWYGVDYHRYDKFLMLVRRVLRQAFDVLKKAAWSTEYVDIFTEILSETVLKTENTSALGLTLHVIEIYLEELAKVSEGNLSHDNVLGLVEPFGKLLARTEEKRIVTYIKKYIFRYLMMQSDLGLDYHDKFQAWKRAGFPGGHINAMTKLEIENEEDENEAWDEMDNDEKKALDPRAGRVDVDLPQLHYNAPDFAKMFEEFLSAKDTSNTSRRIIKQLLREFKAMGRGKFPIAIKKMPTITTKDKKLNVKAAVKRLNDFEKSLIAPTVKKKAAKAAKNDRRKPSDESEKFEEFVRKSEDGIFGQISDEETQPKRKLNGEAMNGNVQNKKSKKRKLSVGKVEMKRNSTEDGWTIVPAKRQKLQSQQIVRNSGIWFVDDLVQQQTQKRAKKAKKLGAEKSSESADMKHKETKNTDQKSPNIVLNPFSSPVTKKIKFALDLNESQEIHEHHAKVSESPNIPYDATKRPSKPLLKINTPPGPINPFYRRRM